MYSVMFYDMAGNRTDIISDVLQISAVLSTNGVSSWTVRLVDRGYTIRPNLLVEIWRGTQRLVGGFVRDWDRPFNTLILYGLSFEYLLSGKIVAYAANTDETGKTGPANDVIKGIVRENLGADAITARQYTGVTVQADDATGETVSRAFARRGVLTVCKALAAESYQKGTRVYFGFDTSLEGSPTFNFITKTDQWGSDRTLTSAAPTVFGTTFGNLADYVESNRYKNHANYIYVGGQGVAENRLVVEVEDTTSTDLDPWARRERFASHTNELTTTGLTSAGEQILRDFRHKETFKGQLINTPNTQYGSDWVHGDRVAILQNQRSLEGIIDKTQVSFVNGKETINAVVEGNL